MTDHELQPIPEALRIAADLRRLAGELLLRAKILEESCPQPERREKVKFLFARPRTRGTAHDKRRSPKKTGKKAVAEKAAL